jgi:peroxiredoxin
MKTLRLPEGRLTVFLCVLSLLPRGQITAANAAATISDEIPVVIPHPTTVLLHADSVYRELGLTESQQTAVDAAASRADIALWRLRDVPVGERNRRARVLLDALRAEVRTTFTQRQLERFDQLVLQGLGMRAVLEPLVAERLNLSSDQRRRVCVALALLARDPATAERLRGQVESRVLTILTDYQRRLLTRLRGDAFDFRTVRPGACRTPELESVTAWINAEPLTLESLRGKVVVVHFYTFGCINCIHNLPHYNAWYDRFGGAEFEIVGIHRPETQGERDIDQVRRRAKAAGQKYPIAVDNDARNWNLWANHVWPSVYLIDKRGFVRYWWYGELNWQGTEGEKWMRERITDLLAEPDPR